MDRLAQSERLHARVREIVAAWATGRSHEALDGTALDIARFQAEGIPAIARLVRARGVDLGAARSADAIPALPTDVFRLTRVAVHPASLDARVFRTSGTTQGEAARGEHALRTTATYEAAALAFGRAMLWPDAPPARTLVLAATADEAPESSLGFMLDLFARAIGAPASWHLVRGELDVAGVARAAARARDEGGAALVLGTSFAFVHLLDRAGGLDLSLPPASRVMQTGGFKGRSREVEARELRQGIAGAFGLAPSRVVGEYGMTELSSQLYEAAIVAKAIDAKPIDDPAREPLYVAPPWVRVTAVDPLTLEAVAPGQIGLARIVDLANVDSAVAIQTADRVRVHEGGVELLGRQPGAPPRGCSISVDEALGRGGS